MRNAEEHQGSFLLLLFSVQIADKTRTACTAYSRYILDVGSSEDWFALQIALLPCLIGYGMIATRLHNNQDPSKPKEANRYRKWIENYIAEDYREAIKEGSGMSSSSM